MKSFVGNVSSYEGAEIPGESLVEEDISFDSDRFMDNLNQLLGMYIINY